MLNNCIMVKEVEGRDGLKRELYEIPRCTNMLLLKVYQNIITCLEEKNVFRGENPTLRQWIDPDARDTSDFSFKSTLILGWKLSFHVNWTSTWIWFAIFLPDVKLNPILFSWSLDRSSKHCRAKGTTDPGIEYFKLINSINSHFGFTVTQSCNLW